HLDRALLRFDLHQGLPGADHVTGSHLDVEYGTPLQALAELGQLDLTGHSASKEKGKRKETRGEEQPRDALSPFPWVTPAPGSVCPDRCPTHGWPWLPVRVVPRRAA